MGVSDAIAVGSTATVADANTVGVFEAVGESVEVSVGVSVFGST
jgi:hypothetical protein